MTEAKPKQAYRWLGIGGIVLLAAWLFLPALTPAHIEVFSQRLQSEAISFRNGNVLADDLNFPVAPAFLFASRRGTVLAVAGVMRLTHSFADWNFKLVLILSNLIFIASCLIFARRWSGRSRWLSLLFFVCTPGLTEIGFFLADNLLSASMAALSLALIPRRFAWWRWLLVGACVGAAMAFRLDGILIIPSILVVAALRDRFVIREIAIEVVAAVAGAAAVLIAVTKISGVTLHQAMQISSSFTHLLVVSHQPLRVMALALEYFFGITSAILVLYGVQQSRQSWSLRKNLCLTLYPIVLYLGLMSQAYEFRNFLLLGAPFLVLQGTQGVARLLDLLLNGEGRQRRLAAIAVAVCVISMAVPPTRLIMKDGPRSFTGRLWTIPIWRAWQRVTDEDIALTRNLVESIKPGETLLAIAAQFNADGYLHTSLLQHGYTISPESAELPGAVEVYRKGDRSLVEIRSEDPWLITTYMKPPYAPMSVQTDQFLLGLDAAHSMPAQRTVLMMWGHTADEEFLLDTPEYLRVANGCVPRMRDLTGWYAGNSLHVGRLCLEEARPEDLDDLRARLLKRRATIRSYAGYRQIGSPEELHQLYTVEALSRTR